MFGSDKELSPNAAEVKFLWLPSVNHARRILILSCIMRSTFARPALFKDIIPWPQYCGGFVVWPALNA